MVGELVDRPNPRRLGADDPLLLVGVQVCARRRAQRGECKCTHGDEDTRVAGPEAGHVPESGAAGEARLSHGSSLGAITRSYASGPKGRTRRRRRTGQLVRQGPVGPMGGRLAGPCRAIRRGSALGALGRGRDPATSGPSSLRLDQCPEGGPLARAGCGALDPRVDLVFVRRSLDVPVRIVCPDHERRIGPGSSVATRSEVPYWPRQWYDRS